MFVLDTNHLTELAYHSAAGDRLRGRLINVSAEVATTIISVEEELRGLLAEINRRSEPMEQLPVYRKLAERVNFFSRWSVLQLDGEAAALFARLRNEGLRIGSLDLKIACIAIAHDATLLTRNAKDFDKVPGLRVENWLD